MNRRSRPERARPPYARLRHPETAEEFELPRRLPLLPLRDAVVFPRTLQPLFVGRPASVAALERAGQGDRLLLTATQRRPDCPQPGRDDLHAVGTVVRVLQDFRQADGTRRVLLEGLAPAGIGELSGGEASYRILTPAGATDPEAPDLVERVKSAFRDYIQLERRVPREAPLGVDRQSDPTTVAYRIAAHVRVRPVIRQRLLECADPVQRLRLLLRILASEIDGLRAEACLRRQGRPRQSGVSRQVPEGEGHRQRVRESSPGASMAGRATAPETSGEADDPQAAEYEELVRAVERARLPAHAAERAGLELARLQRTMPLSPEATVSRNYIDWLLALPWRRRTRERRDLERAIRILDEDHFGMSRVKERIIELIAVLKLAGRTRGSILCLVGPPGVGKTSFGRGIARALGRRFVRMSLGGLRDEAEIRGHRRTYVGSLPGRILQAMRRAGSINPVILLDEVDKLNRDGHGDPAAALLEVLDPEQNHAFNDHYLEIDYDLSHVLFIATANVLEAIPPALRDRMETIRLPGYLEGEKLEIAKRFLLPRQRKASGLVAGDLDLTAAALTRLIRGYTCEAGVRTLEREIAHLCRKAAKLKAGGPEPALAGLARTMTDGKTQAAASRRARGLGIVVDEGQLEAILGVAPQDASDPCCAHGPGVATGLAWTPGGGEALTVEVGVLPGRGRLLLTGQLGAQMRESARAALSYVRSQARALDLALDFAGRVDIHIHIPKGAIPKDGPSAGVTLALALASALSGWPTRAGVAMTGEITLRGHVLPVGGLAEKLVAARRAGVKTVLVPRANAGALRELPAELREGLDVVLVDTMAEVLAHGLDRAGARETRPAAPTRARRTRSPAATRARRSAAARPCGEGMRDAA
ncbi:MAG: endopeptidase La [Candidatus Eisenbacteria bacterium]